jgi:hypothetical protein
MDNVFTAGELIPYSGVYRITHHPPHATEQGITLAKGRKFPRCVDCGHVSFMLLNGLFDTDLRNDATQFNGRSVHNALSAMDFTG